MYYLQQIIHLSCQVHKLLWIDWCSRPIRFFIVSLMYNNMDYSVGYIELSKKQARHFWKSVNLQHNCCKTSSFKVRLMTRFCQPNAPHQDPSPRKATLLTSSPAVRSLRNTYRYSKLQTFLLITRIVQMSELIGMEVNQHFYGLNVAIIRHFIARVT